MQIFIYLFFIFNVCCAGKTNVARISKDQVPSAIKIKGAFIDGVKFKDIEGSHYLIISGSTKGEQYQKNWSSELFAFKVTMDKDSVIKKWEIKDFSENDFSELKFIPNSLMVFDLDSNGIFESRFLYQILRGGDPFTVKYMLHYNNKKYAIRGVVPIGFDDSTDCETNVDSAYDNLNENIGNFAKKDWDSLMTETYSCFIASKRK